MINESNDERRYDFIVVGAGAAGSCRGIVCVRRAGTRHRIRGTRQRTDHRGSKHLVLQCRRPARLPLARRPLTAIEQSQVQYGPRPRTWDGSSINAMVWIRGTQADYDRWAKNGARGWAFADVLPVFKSQEDWEGGANAGRVKWVEGRPGEAPAVAGTDFIIARDGRIAAVYLFFDKLP